jgi:hypothetical protein
MQASKENLDYELWPYSNFHYTLSSSTIGEFLQFMYYFNNNKVSDLSAMYTNSNFLGPCDLLPGIGVATFSTECRHKN